MKDIRPRFPVYRRMLKLYPPAYQKRYGEEMLQTLADMLDGASSSLQRSFIWLRTAIDFPISLAQQQVHYAGEALENETPHFVKRNTLIAFAFFVPFVLLVIINDATAHGLYHTWLWNVDVLTTWILVLPTLGFLVSGATLLMWLAQQQTARGWLRSMFDVRHNWPMLLEVIFGFGVIILVFFHDSVHCVTGNPIRELHDWHTTLRCIQQR
jgi:hypothetical protein